MLKENFFSHFFINQRIAETKKRIISKMMDSEEYNSLQRPFSDGGEHLGLDGETIVK